MARKQKVTAEQVKKVFQESAVKFPKQQIVKSQKYAHRPDALNALLKDDETYTFAQVDEILEKFYKGGSK